MKFWKKNKKGDMDVDTLLPWLIALGLLAVMIAGYLLFKNKGVDSIEFLKNLFRFGS